MKPICFTLVPRKIFFGDMLHVVSGVQKIKGSADNYGKVYYSSDLMEK